MKILLLILIAINVGCASLTLKQKKLVTIGSAAVIGGVVGASTAPKDENKGTHAALWSGVAASVASIYTIYAMDESDAYEVAVKENQLLKDSLDRKINGPKDLKAEGKGLLGSKLPENVRNLVQPGGWKLYQLDRWVKDENNENVFIHQNQALEIIPPSISN